MISHHASWLLCRHCCKRFVTEYDYGSQTDDSTKANAHASTKSHKTAEQDLADIDLADPDLKKAASKIQATFRKRINVTHKKAEATSPTPAATPKPQVVAETPKRAE
jgi:hypothetical protein